MTCAAVGDPLGRRARYGRSRQHPGQRPQTRDRTFAVELQDRLAGERRASCKDLAQIFASRYLDLLDNLRSATGIPPFRANSYPLRLKKR